MRLLVLLVLAAGLVLPCRAHTDEHQYHGIRPTDPDGRNGLRNPERGWRIETLVAEPPGKPAWGPAYHLKDKVSSGYSDDWWLLDAKQYEPQGLTLAQTYCYLNEYLDGPIPDEKIAWLKSAFSNLRAAGLKALLRFAYERGMDKKAGPDLKLILQHMDQLAPIVRENADVIYVMQAGFIGAWGEWHSSAKNIEGDHANMAAIIAKVLQILPDTRMTQVRVPKYKRWALEQPVLNAYQVLNDKTAFSGIPAARIGFHNDGFLAYNNCGGTWTEPPLYSNPGNPEFDYMTHESPYVPVDGELFWSDIGGKVEGLRAAIRMRLHHYSSFSLAHSFVEREGKPFSIDDWIKTPITVEQIREAKLPLSDGYFEDETGKTVARTQFEYIRDHLGYRIELQGAQFAPTVAPGNTCPVEIELINRGFSTLHNPRRVLVALIDKAGAMAHVAEADADPRTWQPFKPGDPEFAPLKHKIALSIPLPKELAPGVYRLGLWMPDSAESIRKDARYAIRCANRDVPWWTDGKGQYGVNILGKIEIQKP